jgi:hypothetical protein
VFTRDLSATASYRTLARGHGRTWAHTLRASQESHAERRAEERRATARRPLTAVVAARR